MTEVKTAVFDDQSPEIQTDFDIHDPAGVETLFDDYAALRSKCPVAHSTKWGGHWVTTRYDDISEIMRNPEVFSSECVNIPPTIGQDGPMIPLEHRAGDLRLDQSLSRRESGDTPADHRHPRHDHPSRRAVSSTRSASPAIMSGSSLTMPARSRCTPSSPA